MRGYLLYGLLGAALAQTASADEQYLSYAGTATERHSSKFLYTERNVLTYRDGRLSERVVLYTCQNGEPFARKIVVYVDPRAPDFDFEDVSNTMREGIRSAGTTRTMFFRGSKAEPQKEAPLPVISALVADAGFDEYIRMDWAALTSGKPQQIHFLVPSRLEAMAFQVEHLRSATIDGVPAEVFRLKLAGLLGWVLPGIDVSYGAEDHVLMNYDGISDLRDASGNNLQAQIVFHAKDRKATDAAAGIAARQARLAPCHAT